MTQRCCRTARPKRTSRNVADWGVTILVAGGLSAAVSEVIGQALSSRSLVLFAWGMSGVTFIGFAMVITSVILEEMAVNDDG